MGARTFIVIAVALAGCGRWGFEDEPVIDGSAPTSWWDTSFTVRSRLDLDRRTPDDAHADFPLLVVLDATRFDRSAARADLGDLRFVTSAGVVLDHELEANDGATVLAWVRVPMIAAGTKPTLWLYYGNPSATARPGAVWSSSYVGVWHFDGATDASAAHNDGVANGATAVAGEIGHGLDFAAGGNGYVEVPDSASLHWADNVVTASGWMKLRTYQQMFSELIGRQRAAGGAWNDFYLGIGSQKLHGQMTNPTPNLLYSPAAVPVREWLHLGLVYDGSMMTIYLAGVKSNMVAMTDPLGSAAKPMYLGADCNGAGNPDTDFTNGAIDEIRLETVARSAAWMASDHASMTDSWITYGPVER